MWSWEKKRAEIPDPIIRERPKRRKSIPFPEAPGDKLTKKRDGTVLIKCDGVEKTLEEWAAYMGLKVKSLKQRLDRYPIRIALRQDYPSDLL